MQSGTRYDIRSVVVVSFLVRSECDYSILAGSDIAFFGLIIPHRFPPLFHQILLLVSHSQDFLNNVCSHMVHFTNRRKLVYYDGNYDQFVKTKAEKEENQLKQYKWEQEQIKSMKEYIARFGHGTSKNAKQAQSKEKVLEKMVRAGLTEKPEEEKPLNFKFTDPGPLPPPVLAFHDVSFGYPGCEPLYTNVNFGVDLDSRVALVGPNGAGKTVSEYLPSYVLGAQM